MIFPKIPVRTAMSESQEIRLMSALELLRYSRVDRFQERISGCTHLHRTLHSPTCLLTMSP